MSFMKGDFFLYFQRAGNYNSIRNAVEEDLRPCDGDLEC